MNGSGETFLRVILMPQVLWLFFVLLTLFVFALTQWPRLRNNISLRVQKQGSSLFLGPFLMEYAYWIIGPIARAAVRWELSPNHFSWICLALGAASGVAAALGALTTAGMFSFVSSACDTLDGFVARARKIDSDAGEILDAAVDRYTEFFFLGGLILHYRHSTPMLLLILAALMGSYLVSYSQAKAEILKLTVPKGSMRRPERALFLAVGTFFGAIHGAVLVVALGAVAVFSNWTAVQRFHLMYQLALPKPKSDPSRQTFV